MAKYNIEVDTEAGMCKVMSGDKEMSAKRIRISKYNDMNWEKGTASPKCSIEIEDEMENEDGSKSYMVTRASLQDFLQKTLKS